jgi:TatD DNase family protein
MWIDSHCHLSDERLLPRLPQLFDTMTSHAVDAALVIGTTLSDCETVLDIVENNNAIPLYASVGVHPEQKDSEAPTVEKLLSLAARSSKVLAIGETGLDYHWFPEAHTNPAALQWQRDHFATHIQAAIACDKPLVVHTREASKDTIAVLTSENAQQCGGVIHCFTETWDVAKAALDLGFYISFSGIVTFKSAADLREVALKIPADRILVETDAPYLAPIPKRGKDNEPAFVSHVGDFLAQLRGVDSQQFAAMTSQNFWSLFDRKRLFRPTVKIS